jgi:hypothetical protein
MSEKPAIPPVFNQPGANFVLLLPGEKFPPIEKEWQKKGHSFQEADAHVKKGGNIGVMAGGGYIGLDEDDPSAFEGLQLPPTTGWETRPGRLGFLLKCSDRNLEVLSKYGLKADQAQIKLFRNGLPIGEIKLERTYQVIPPSSKKIDGQRVDYGMISDDHPAEIALDRLLSELIRIGITFSKKASASNQNPSNTKKCAATGKKRARRYAEVALKNEVKKLADTSIGERNDQLNKSGFALSQFISAGLLDKAEIIRELSGAAAYLGLSPDEIEKTIRSGIEAGACHPREIPPLVDWKETVKQALISMAHACDGALVKDGIGFRGFRLTLAVGSYNEVCPYFNTYTRIIA